TRVPQSPDPLSRAPRGDLLAHRNFFENLMRTISFELGIMTSSMPRGGLQVIQPQRLPEVFHKGYSRGFGDEDRATWQSILKNNVLSGNQAWGGASNFENSRYRKEFMRQCGLGYVAAAPLTAPILGGYPGAVHLYRAEERGDFNNSDLT